MEICSKFTALAKQSAFKCALKCLQMHAKVPSNGAHFAVKRNAPLRQGAIR